MKAFLLILGLSLGMSLGALDLKELETFIEKAQKELEVPGVSVSVVLDGKVAFAKGFGIKKQGSQEAVDENTIFQTASVAKTFTAAGLAVLVDKGKLGWDEEVIEHLPEFALKQAYPSRYATSRDLLAHRTGLPAFGGDLLGKIGYTPNEILYRVRFIDPATSFRNRAYYSNIGYFVAGELLGRLSGSTWEEAVRETLLKPLKMNRSGFAANLENSNVAYPHVLEGGEVHVVDWDRTGGFPAAGAITSTARDMGNWMVLQVNQGAFEGRQIIQPKTVKEMHLPSMVGEASFSEMPPIDEMSGFSFGLGWDCYHYQGRMIVEKGGGLDGMRSVVTLIPEIRAGITILSNLNLTVLPEMIRAKFLQLVLGQTDEKMFEEILSRQKVLNDLVKRRKPPEDALPQGHKLKDYKGVFENDLYGTFIVKEKQGALVLEAGPARWQGTMTLWSNDTFLLSWPVVNSGSELVTFTFGPEGKPLQLITETLGVFKIAEYK